MVAIVGSCPYPPAYETGVRLIHHLAINIKYYKNLISNNYNLNPDMCQEFLLFINYKFWCPRRESNPHAIRGGF